MDEAVVQVVAAGEGTAAAALAAVARLFAAGVPSNPPVVREVRLPVEARRNVEVLVVSTSVLSQLRPLSLGEFVAEHT